jgi:hypothetical protein
MILMPILKINLYLHGIQALNPTHGLQAIPMNKFLHKKLNENINSYKLSLITKNTLRDNLPLHMCRLEIGYSSTTPVF